jgi:uridine phosphorylase
MTYLITPAQTIAAARRGGLGHGQLCLSGVAVLTFSEAVIERLQMRCALRDVAWISALHHPYSTAAAVKRGTFEGIGITVLVPPMGASPLACVVEDLVACGVQAVFLVCAAWSLGPPVRLADLIVPAVSLGPDGTSIHYGNAAGEVSAHPAMVGALLTASRGRGASVHVGGNGSCEALYRITPRMAAEFRARECLCMDNGEAATLLAVAHKLDVLAGVLFQPYVDLTRGWDPAWLQDERYLETGALQADVTLEAATRLRSQGWVSPERE